MIARIMRTQFCALLFYSVSVFFFFFFFLFFSWSTSCSSWSEHSEDKSLYGAEIQKPDPQSCPSLYGTGLYKCPSVLSLDSVASTFLPSPSPDSTRSSSATRIGTTPVAPKRLVGRSPTALLHEPTYTFIHKPVFFQLCLLKLNFKQDVI